MTAVDAQQALVLSGGGAYAAYEVGVMKALLGGHSPATEHRPIDPQIVTGASAGAFNATLLADRWEISGLEAIAQIEEVWLTEIVESACGNGVFRWRGSPFNALDLRCLAREPLRFFWERLEDSAFFFESFLRRGVAFARSEAPLERRLLELVNISNLISTAPFPHLIRRVIDFEHVRRSCKTLRVVATNWRSGELRVFDNEDMSPDSGPPIIMASSAIPGIFPPVDIPPEVFVDGGLLMNTPLSPAIHAGATELHVVYLDPDVSTIPLAELQTTLDTLQRTFAIALAGIFNRDIEAAERVNRSLALARGLSSSAELGSAEARELFEVLEILRDRLRSERPFKMLTIHRYHPHDLLGGALGVLGFERETLTALIERGFEDARNHDCRDCDCVLPPAS